MALADPGVFTERRHDVGPNGDEPEPLTDWQARAVSTYLREWATDVEDKLTTKASSVFRGLADLIDERQA